eukprot:CAMPEP_0172668502 /NCGR_PEP_ID=MMETSP1074-20121228/9103_1 /TAXON_ID=2916 /ORGANISM="Ceratium fusus, Strain PA161109" /LENGTH=85 /DNA_ID=CAMNT_0013485159 /DNA_START=235 /DNA_END=489 /DNA_ORIENTATION=+
MEVAQSNEEVVQQRVDVQGGQRDVRSAELLEVRVADLHHHVQFLECVHVPWGDNIIEAHNIIVVQLAKDCTLAENAFAINQVFKH